MLMSLVLALSSSSLGAPPEFSPRLRAVPDLDVLRRQELKRTRRTQAMLKANIELFEQMLEQRTAALSPDRAARIRQTVKNMRAAVEQEKRYERQLWEQQPGGISAPMPHEVKPPVRD